MTASVADRLAEEVHANGTIPGLYIVGHTFHGRIHCKQVSSKLLTRFLLGSNSLLRNPSQLSGTFKSDAATERACCPEQGYHLPCHCGSNQDAFCSGLTDQFLNITLYEKSRPSREDALCIPHVRALTWGPYGTAHVDSPWRHLRLWRTGEDVRCRKHSSRDPCLVTGTTWCYSSVISGLLVEEEVMFFVPWLNDATWPHRVWYNTWLYQATDANEVLSTCGMM
jgi:hypothetical protein